MNYTTPISNGFTIYSKSGCLKCNSVKNFIKDAHLLFEEINCDAFLEEDKESFLTFINQLTNKNCKQFPMVFYNKNYIGGLIETIDFIDKLLLSFEDNF